MKLRIITILIFLSQIIHAQVAETEVKLNVIFDRTNYASGEIANGFLFAEGIAIKDKAIKFTVKNVSTDEVVYQASFKVKNNESGFYIPILPEFKSGTYSVDFFACSIENFSTRNVIELLSTTINIINISDTKLNRSLYFERKNIPSNITVNSSLKTVVKPNNSGLQFNLTFNQTNKDSILLVCIGDDSENGLNIVSEQKKFNQTFVNTWTDKIFEQIKVTDNSGQKLFSLLALYSHDCNKMFISKSNEEGNAVFLLDDYEGLHNFNLLAYQNYNIREDESKASSKVNDLTQISDKNWNIILTDAEESRKREEIHHYFGVNTFILKSPQLMKKQELPKPYWTFNVSDYKKFPDLQTFCKENSIELKFVSKKQNVTANLSPPPRFGNSYNAIWENPFFLIDGKAVNDYKKIAAMKPEDINTLQIYYDKKDIIPWLYAFGSNGVVVIETKTKTGSTPSFHFNGLQNNMADHQVIIADGLSGGNPIIIPTLLWKNNIKDRNTSIAITDNSDKTVKKITVLYKHENNVYYTTTPLK